MAHLGYVDPESATEAVRALFETDAEDYGRPSLFARAMAHNPGLLEARKRYTSAVGAESGLEPRVVELVTVVISATNESPYCVASHVETLIDRLDIPTEEARAIRDGEYASLSGRERAVVSLAEQVARDPGGVEPATIETLRDAGFDAASIVGLVTVCAMAVSANVIADSLGIDPADRPTPFTGAE